MISYRNPHIMLLVNLIALLLPTSLRAEDVLIASPYWQGFTSPDDESLYHDLMRAIYEPGGKTVRHLEVPAKRRLAAQDKLAPIYTKWNQPMPRAYQK